MTANKMNANPPKLGYFHDSFNAAINIIVGIKCISSARITLGKVYSENGD